MINDFESFKRAMNFIYKINVTPDEYEAVMQLMAPNEDSRAKDDEYTPRAISKKRNQDEIKKRREKINEACIKNGLCPSCEGVGFFERLKSCIECDGCGGTGKLADYERRS